MSTSLNSASASSSDPPPRVAPLTEDERAALADRYAAVLSTARSLNPEIQVLPVSKTKSVEMIQVLRDAGVETFGENYVQELCSKMEHFSSTPSPPTFIFIGALQSNKINKLLSGAAAALLLRVDTVSSVKVANKLAKAAENWEGGRRLGVCVQIDTSLEDAKSGVAYDDLPAVQALVEHIKSLTSLEYKGVMTIGAPNDSECFDRLKAVHAVVGGEVVSMGMSGDFEEAIGRGASEVRCGSNIFGARSYPSKK